jgi:YHS domain-containing protein
MYSSVVSFIVLSLGLAWNANAGKSELKPQTVCPVKGCPLPNAAIDQNQFVDYQGQRIYYGCGDCKVAFLKDPEKYFAKIHKDGILLENIQKTCPVMGGEINKKLFMDYEGRRIYFCCKGCRADFNQAPVKYLQKLPGENLTAGITETVPAINPESHHKH